MEDFEYEQDEPQVLDPNIRKQLREAEKVAKEAAEARKQLQELQKDLAFTKAGIPEDGTGALVRKAYDGELTPEAVRQFAEQHGVFGQKQAASTQDGIPDAELDSMRRVAGAAAGAGGTPPVNVEAAFSAALANAQSETETMNVITQFYRENPEIGFFPKGAFN